FGQQSGAIITSCIMSAAGSRTRFTCWLQHGRKGRPNRRWFGAQWEVRSTNTQHSSMLCEAGSWTTARIIRIEPSYEALHHDQVDIRGLAINHAINCQKAGKLRGLFFRASVI